MGYTKQLLKLIILLLDLSKLLLDLINWWEYSILYVFICTLKPVWSCYTVIWKWILQSGVILVSGPKRIWKYWEKNFVGWSLNLKQVDLKKKETKSALFYHFSATISEGGSGCNPISPPSSYIALVFSCNNIGLTRIDSPLYTTEIKKNYHEKGKKKGNTFFSLWLFRGVRGL